MTALYYTGWLLLGCAGLLVLLLAIEAFVTWYQGWRPHILPPPDSLSERNRRALAAYRNNARAHSGLRERA